MTRTEQLLRDLIALPSVNPAFLPPRDPRAGEGRIAEFVASLAARAGLDIEFQEVLPGRPNILARLLPRGEVRHRVLLAPHLDTVPADDAQFKPRIRHGRLYGRGACDTKGSVAAMLSAMLRLARQGPRPHHTELVFVGLVDEESMQAGSRAFVREGCRADLAIVGEATCLKVVTAHKGSLWMLLETEGRSAHGARPELGVNAVHLMARVVDALESEYAAQLRKRNHPLLGNPTVSVGTISGGTQVNIVPDRCVISVDRRTIPGETLPGVKREISTLLAKKKLAAKVSCRKQEPCFPLETSPDLPLVRAFLDSARQPGPVGVRYFCDASILSRGGIPSVVFGPGDIAQAHTVDEWISLASLRKAEAMLLRYFATLP
jgi:acetylornithine deacetylase/succinyl-diaminopimelate desuccinylase family protein